MYLDLKHSFEKKIDHEIYLVFARDHKMRNWFAHLSEDWILYERLENEIEERKGLVHQKLVLQ